MDRSAHDPYAPREALVGVPPSPTVQVPAGTVPAVVAWVGDDPLRAAAALRAEKSKPKRDQRSTLLRALEELVGPR